MSLLTLSMNMIFLCFSETKTDKADIPLIDIAGYTCYLKNRTDLAVRRSGGIAIYVKEELSPFMHVIESPCSCVLWLSCNGIMLTMPDNFLIGAVYIPPESSKYSSPDISLQIEQNILSHSVNYKYIHVALIGDFNSRTCVLPDYIDIDEDDIDPDLITNDVCILDNLNIQRARKSCDTQINNFGYHLLNLCKHTNIFIANGRIGMDRNVGRFTCKNTSVIDYCLCNANFMSLISDFEVMGFSHQSSDVHNALFVELKCVYNPLTETMHSNEHVHTEKDVIVYRWNDEKEHIFRDSIVNRMPEIDDITDKLLSVERHVVDNNFIDTVIDEMCNIFTKSAIKAFGTRDVEDKSINKFVFKKPWFTKHCKSARQNYRKAKRMFRKYGGDIFKEDFYEKERAYKKTVKKSVACQRYQMKEKLKYLRTKKPRDYWKIIYSGNVKPKQSVPIDDLYEFFKKLNDENDNTIPDNVATMDDLNLLSDVNVNVDINVCITEDEIMKCVKSLKRNRSTVDDAIANEYILSTIAVMMPLYTVLFNTIFDTGVVFQPLLILRRPLILCGDWDCGTKY